MLHSLIERQPYDLARLTFFLRRLANPDQPIVNCHAADYENDQRNVDPANYPGTDRSRVSESTLRHKLGGQVDPAHREVHPRPDMALPARLRQIGWADHRFRIGGGQDVVNAMTARAVRDYLRTHARCQAMVAFAITTDTLTRDSEFPRERHTFVAPCAGVCSHCCQSVATRLFDRRSDAVDAVTVSTNR